MSTKKPAKGGGKSPKYKKATTYSQGTSYASGASARAKKRAADRKAAKDAMRERISAPKNITASGARKSKRKAGKSMGKIAKSVGGRASCGYVASRGKAGKSACGQAAAKHGFSTVNKKSKTARRSTKR